MKETHLDAAQAHALMEALPEGQPTMTIQALAFRAAEHIAEAARRGDIEGSLSGDFPWPTQFARQYCR